MEFFWHKKKPHRFQKLPKKSHFTITTLRAKRATFILTKKLYLNFYAKNQQFWREN